MLMAKVLLVGACVLQVVVGSITTTTASSVVLASSSSLSTATSGATAITVPDSPPLPPPLQPLPLHPLPVALPLPPPPTQGPSPFLPIIGIFILMLAFLGFASTIIALPFHLSPSTLPPPAAGSRGKSGTEAKVKVPSSTPTLRWMTFFLVLCVGVVMVQGRFGLGPGSWTRAGSPVGPPQLGPAHEGQLALVGVGVGAPVQVPPWGHNLAGRGGVAQVIPAQHVQPAQPAQHMLNHVPRGKQQFADPQTHRFANSRPRDIRPNPNDPAGPPSTANLESFFYPLLVGAIALLVIFDYAS